MSNSLDSITGWRRRVRGWLIDLRTIDTTVLVNRPEWATYGVLRELLQDSVATTVCRGELWQVSTAFPGWQVSYTSLAGLQPIGTDLLRAQALARARALPGFVRNEIANLREGMRLGYSSPRAAVAAVVRQLDAILAVPPERSPFASPAQRDSTPGFQRELIEVVANEIYPATRSYRDFLEREYLPQARESLGVSSNPDGVACYQAAVRRFTTLTITPDELYREGERQLEKIEHEMRDLAL